VLDTTLFLSPGFAMNVVVQGQSRRTDHQHVPAPLSEGGCIHAL
jgi:hypothetical protein